MSGQSCVEVLTGRWPVMGVYWALPEVLGHLQATPIEEAQEAVCARLHVTVFGALRQTRHGGEVAHLMGD